MIERWGTFSSITDLLTVVERDQSAPSRFPARFILVNSLGAWASLLSGLRQLVDQEIRLSHLCTTDDTLPRLMEASQLADVSSDRRYLISPLAEVLRLFPDECDFLTSLATREYLGRGRIYVPLFDLEDIFLRAVENVERMRRGDGPEVWRLDGSSGNVTVATLPFHVPGALQGIRCYLETWESNRPPEFTLVNTQWAPYLIDRAGRVRLKHFSSAFEYLRRASFQLPDQVQESWGSDHQWKWLVSIIDNHSTFAELAAHHLNVARYDAQRPYAGWSALDSNDRWLLYVWSRLESPPKTYLSRALANCQSVTDLPDALASTVFEFQPSLPTLRERRQLLLDLGVEQLPAVFWEQFSSILDPVLQLAALPGLSEKEHEEGVRLVAKLLEQSVPQETWLPLLELNYPELAYYLGSAPSSDPTLCEYFSAYAKCRILDAPDEHLKSLVQQVAAHGKLWSFPTRGTRLEELGANPSEVLWIDALGFEWAGLLTSLLRALGFNVTCEPVRANLPSSTKYNRAWGDAEVSRKLDDIAHHYEYSFPGSFCEQLATVASFARIISGKLQGREQLVVSSDHGLTRFAGSVARVEPPDSLQIESWGRYGILPDQSGAAVSTSDAWVVQDDKVILTQYGQFVGSPAFRGEIHGGATVEEVIVPIIRVSRTGPRPALSFRLLTPRIRLNVRGEGQVKGETDQMTSDLQLSFHGHVIHGVCQGVNRWAFALSGIGPGKYTASVQSEGATVAQVEFEVSRGMVEGDLGL